MKEGHIPGDALGSFACPIAIAFLTSAASRSSTEPFPLVFEDIVLQKFEVTTFRGLEEEVEVLYTSD